MLIDLFDKAKALDADIGRRAREYQPDKKQSENEKIINKYMEQKDKCIRYLGDIEKNVQILKELRSKYEQAADSNLESELLASINKYNEKNTHYFRDVTNIHNEMKEQAKVFKNSAALKNEPEGRIMNGLNNAVETKTYQVLQKSQMVQVEIKSTVKSKISRQIQTVDPTLTEDKIAAMIDDPEAVQEALQAKIFASTHNQVRNAIQDVNSSYQELGKLEKNVKQLYEMIQDLSIIVKNQTSILNSIEENLKATKNYIHKAEVNILEAKKQYMEGNERLCCIAVCLVFIVLAVMWPILSIVA